MSEKKQEKYRYFIRGRKDQRRRYVHQLPNTVDKVGGARYVDCQMLVGGKYVVQKIREDRIEREKVQVSTPS